MNLLLGACYARSALKDSISQFEPTPDRPQPMENAISLQKAYSKEEDDSTDEGVSTKMAKYATPTRHPCNEGIPRMTSHYTMTPHKSPKNVPSAFPSSSSSPTTAKVSFCLSTSAIERKKTGHQ